MELEQIFEYAIEQETRAREFYESSATSTDNVSAKVLFKDLARMEIGHKRVLENELNLLRSAGEIKPKPKLKNPQEEMLSSLYRMTKVLREANVELEAQHKIIQAELDMAAQIQTSLLPRKIPQFPDLEISVACFMARTVGGDFYDFVINPLGELSFSLGDVSGKGVPAALLMVAVRTLWRSAIRDGYSPEKTLEILAEDITQELSESDQFVTMLSGIYNPASSTFSFSNAGHWPPLFFSAKDQAFIPIPPGFLPLGIDSGFNYGLSEFELNKDDIVLFFSDGLVEARNEKRIQFGEDRVKNIILKNKALSAEKIRELLIHEVDGYSNSRREDDLTIAVFKKIS